MIADKPSARVFFFRHSLTRNGQSPAIPGRFAFEVRASALLRRGGELRLNRSWQGHIYADAYADEKPALNVDPNVFSDALPWHLSFCRISDQKQKNRVQGKVLSQLVEPGDVVVFGTVVSKHILAVDTVLCVGLAADLPTVGDRFALRENFDGLKSEVPELGGRTWSQFAATRTFQLNLADAEGGGSHDRTDISPHRIVVGRRWHQPEDVTETDLARRFLERRGFNFIPLRDERASRNRAIRTRPGLFCARFANAQTVIEHHVELLNQDDADRLLRVIFELSDLLVLDPLEPVRALRRHTASEAPLSEAS